MRIRHLHRVGELLRAAQILVDRYAEHHQTRALVGGVDAIERRHLLARVAGPARPKIHQHHLAAKFGQAQIAAVQAFNTKSGASLPTMVGRGRKRRAAPSAGAKNQAAGEQCSTHARANDLEHDAEAPRLINHAGNPAVPRPLS